MTTTTALCIAPIEREEALHLAHEAISRELVVLRSLAPEEWERPTACPAWTVRQIVLHQVASARALMSPAEGLRQTRAGKRLEAAEGLPGLDAFMVAGQRRLDSVTADQALEMCAVVLPSFARFRRRFPEPLRTLVKVPTNDAKVRLGYLFDRVINRDHFMHRLDICAATGREPVVTAEHDGRIVEDVVQDWAGRHGKPFALTLTGPAGGQWSWGVGGEVITMDALDFARVLSGRGHGEGLLATPVLF